MSMRLLSTTGDERTLIVVPGPAVEHFDGPAELPVELRRPDRSVGNATLLVERVFVVPTPKIQQWGLRFANLTQRDVPIGTEIWA
jgi:hypothetical protein